MVKIINHQNSSSQHLGYLLIHIQEYPSHVISIRYIFSIGNFCTIRICSCFIPTMCIPDVEYQLINPSTQVSLVSRCVDN